MNNKVIIFDLDDTLISEKEYIDSGFKSIANYFAKKYKLSLKEVHFTIEKLFKKNNKKVFNRLFEVYGIVYKDDDIKELVKIYREHLPSISLLEDAKLLLEELKKRDIKLGIITDGYKETQNRKIKKLELKKIVEKIIVTDELGREYWKPSKKSFEIMKEYFKVEYSDMIYIGDNITKDFLTPNKLGMISIQIEREKGIYKNLLAETEEYLPQLKVKNLLEVIQILDLGEKNV